MRALVVYESMFGNTRDVAEAIAAGLGEHADVTVAEVATAPTVMGEMLDLLVVGGPTHAFGLSRETTRASAVDQSDQPLVSSGLGLRDWLADLRVEPGLRAATFDTHADKPNLPGSAAAAARRRLRRLRLRVIAPPESFYVEGMTGPLRAGELERARAWGRHLATEVTAELTAG